MGYRWYIHIAALQGIQGLSVTAPAPAPASAPAAPAKKAKKEEDDDDFDVFGDDDEEEDEEPKESRAEMLARLKKEAEERTLRKEAKQRTLVAIEVKPWDTEQDLMALWKKMKLAQRKGLSGLKLVVLLMLHLESRKSLQLLSWEQPTPQMMLSNKLKLWKTKSSRSSLLQ